MPRRNEDFMASVVEERMDENLIRAILAGYNSVPKLARWASELGGDNDTPPAALKAALRRRLARLEREGSVRNVGYGHYVACCETCGSPILNAMGNPH